MQNSQQRSRTIPLHQLPYRTSNQISIRRTIIPYSGLGRLTTLPCTTTLWSVKRSRLCGGKENVYQDRRFVEGVTLEASRSLDCRVVFDILDDSDECPDLHTQTTRETY